MRYTAELVLDAKATLGEGPCWDARRQQFLWVDILESKLHIFEPLSGADVEIDTQQYIGAAVLGRDGGIVAALQDGFYRVDRETNKVGLLNKIDHASDVRFNDGKCDPTGRFWAGTMALDERANAGALYVLDTDGSSRVVLSPVTVSNGLAWSSDGQTMYYIDSPTGVVMAFDYDALEGRIGNGRVVVRIPEGEGVPDGMTIDEEGMLWVAQWGGWGVSRFDPETGKRIAFVEVPAAQTSSCEFGGPNMDELYITTARVGLTEDELREQPDAGGVFRVSPGVRGVPANTYGK